MALEGCKSYSHEATIAYSIEFLGVSIEEANRFNKFRKLRNDISYRGAVVTIEEANDIRNLFKDILTKLKLN